MRRRALPVLLAALAASALLAALALAASGPTRLRLNGIGPLKLGMTQAAAVRTGWLAHRTKGCELASPRPVNFRLDGYRAPNGLRGTAEFQNGKLLALAVTRGARTAAGVTVGRATPAQMVARYRARGFKATAKFDSVFQGTFVTVKRRGHTVLMGFAAKKHKVGTLGVPVVPVCE